jgi:predicted ATP-dependent protease
MPATALPAHQLRRTVNPNSLGFDTTARLAGTPLGWIGQDRAAAAAQLGLALNQPDYHLFVLGETGSGRSSLLEQAMHNAAQQRPVPPDLCFVHQFDHPSRPRALRLPAGQGLRLQQAMQALCKQLPDELAQRISQPDVRAQALAIEQQYQTAEAAAFAQLHAFAKQHHYQLERQGRDGSELVLIPLGSDGKPLSATHTNAQALQAQAAEQLQLQERIGDFVAQIRPLDRTRTQAQQTLLHNTAAPLLAAAIAAVQSSLTLLPADAASVQDWLAQVEHALLQHVQLLATGNENSTSDNIASTSNAPTSADDSSDAPDADDDTQDALDELLERCQVNLAINHAGSTCAPVVIEDNPHQRSLFGSIEAQGDARSDAPPNHMAIHAGSLLQAHGGFIMLHLRDLAGPEGLWDRLRRFLRTHRLHIEETTAPGHSAHLQPQAISVHTTIVLIGSVDEYYALQEADPDTAQRFKIKVDFSDTFAASAATYQATAAWVAHTCQQRGLPHLDAAAVAAIIEHTHRQAEDQTRQSALFGRTETLLIESAAACTARMANLAQANPSPAGTAPIVQAQDIAAALHARTLRHNQPEEELLDSITQGERLISVQGTVLGQINALTQIDLGDYCFGFPVRITARTFAGQQGLLNIQREVDMSGPIHDKGMLILHGYLKALFSHVAPLALNASIVFEQEYSGVEGDSASCAELYALLSSLSGLPLQQGIAVTGALNQHGEVLPVGGINEKIEGWFTVCQQAGLNGQQGVLIPARNQRHLMLAPHVQTAVERGQFHVYTMGHVSEGIALLTGQASGMAPADLPAQGGDDVQATVLQRAENTLRAYRRACQRAGSVRRG